MPDENDIVYSTYGIDLAGLIRALFEKIMGSDFDAILERLEFWWNIYSIIAIILAILFFIGFVYARIRLGQLGDIEMAQLKNQEHAWQHAYGKAGAKNDRWEDIQTHITTDNPNDWKLAIIEADIILEDALERAGYIGTSVGDMLKAANFETIEDAWSAHKIRNQIAHAGGDFILTKKIAQETITRYERVFREFDII